MQSVIAAPENESLLVRQAQADAAAFAPIYEFYFPRVYNYMRYRVRDPQLTDDLTAQTFERVLANMHRYHANLAPFGAWLFSIARNVIGDHFRTQKRRRWLSLDALFNHAATDPPPETRADQSDQQQRLLTAVSALPERERDIIALKFAAHLNNRQIAGVTGLSETNVAVILYRTIRQLRGLLQEET
ncbi:MAG: sigma-70 family RNA polymerase sigma factor [Chloroflexi bacterium]|nr:sigma-70 family RNA polymerase sigma factor [Chloroflexota bacterium]MCC6892359.1 sigma-70 family RNA polymerase sigma factor [Anaerolineae bacterium]